MLADLHIHSFYSDSTRSPAEIVQLAKQKGVELLSVCDHNVIDAYQELPCLCQTAGISLLLGCEIHAQLAGCEYHILAYGFDQNSHEMQTLLAESVSVLTLRNQSLVQNLARDFPQISLEEYHCFQRNPREGGWASIAYLLHKGVAQDLDDYFRLCRLYPSHPTNTALPVSVVINTIHRAGGKAVLAHPGKSISSKPEAFVARLSQMHRLGIDGFECYYTTHSPQITQILVDFCRANNLLCTTGSDDHGGFNNRPAGPEYAIGSLKMDTQNLNLEGLSYC